MGPLNKDNKKRNIAESSYELQIKMNRRAKYDTLQREIMNYTSMN